MSDTQKAPNSDTPLASRIKRMIATAGPISVASYMTHCLTDPEHGYYTSRKPIGAQGDFVTAPEVSQLFGELIGIWMLSVWQQAGRPSPFHLVEFGPGRGTLMRDMVRAINSDPDAANALTIHMVDISTSLKKQQMSALSPIKSPIEWHETANTLPTAPLFVVANEFFDCLPIHQWVKHQDKWHERVIGLDNKGELAFGIGPVRGLLKPKEVQSIPDGAIWERSPASEAIFSDLIRRLNLNGGAGLLIDYGYTAAGFGDTFQAMRHHNYADPLLLPGEQDLTAHVNFEVLVQCAHEEIKNAPKTEHALSDTQIIDQGSFLLSIGLLERAGKLGAGKSHAEQEALRDAVERLAAPEQMGELFKVLAILPASIQIPPFSQS